MVRYFGLLTIGVLMACLFNPAATVCAEERGHKAFHGGCLNAIGMCEVGHAEVRVDGDVLKLWFVGGGTDTGTSVRVADRHVTLTVTLPSKEKKTIVLDPRPNELAEETIGDCSAFEAKAPWLSSLKRFRATGKVTLKGRVRNLIIQYPGGYDPD